MCGLVASKLGIYSGNVISGESVADALRCMAVSDIVDVEGQGKEGSALACVSTFTASSTRLENREVGMTSLLVGSGDGLSLVGLAVLATEGEGIRIARRSALNEPEGSLVRMLYGSSIRSNALSVRSGTGRSVLRAANLVRTELTLSWGVVRTRSPSMR